MQKNKVSSLNRWEKYYSSLEESYLFPNEYVVRSFLGSYPNLKMPKDFKGKSICDVGCGDGRNIIALHKFGFHISGTEITEEVCELTRKKLLLHAEKINADLRPGLNDNLPFESEKFDYILSWNACYYMKSSKSNIADHVKELARIMKKDGYMIVSVPSPNCFTLNGSVDLGQGHVRLESQTKWGMLNGTIVHLFRSFEEIEEKFGVHFKNFQKGFLKDDCYGQPLEYFLFVCQKK